MCRETAEHPSCGKLVLKTCRENFSLRLANYINKPALVPDVCFSSVHLNPLTAALINSEHY